MKTHPRNRASRIWKDLPADRFAYQVDLPVCWYAVDDLDQTPERFFTYFIAALHRRFPEFGERSKAALKAINQFNPDINQLVSVIVNDAYEHIQEHFLIILDDYIWLVM